MTIDYSLILTMQANKLAAIETGNDFALWQNSTNSIVGKAFGENSLQIKQFNEIKYQTSEPPVLLGNNPGLNFGRLAQLVDTNNLTHCVDTSRRLILSFVEELTSINNPSAKEMRLTNGVSVDNQTIDVQLVVNTLREELTENQFDELKQLLTSDRSQVEKRKSLSKTLTSFGNDVASGVLASLLTNPHVSQAFI